MRATVRDATQADLARIVELLAQLSRFAPRERPTEPERYRAAFAEIAADPRQRLLVAEVDGRVVGTVVLVIVPNLTHEGRPYAIVENVIVDRDLRGEGVGEALLHFATGEAKRAGCYKLSLTSNKTRTDAHRFYERVGFRATHEGFRIEL